MNLLANTEHKLGLNELLDGLLAEGFITPPQAEKIRPKNGERLSLHPLVILANQGWTHPQQSTQKLHLEFLTQWLATWSGLPYVRIDPLKIDVTAVTSVISRAYAARFNILPVEVEGGSRVVIATAEPFIQEWQQELERMLRLQIERVIANPIEISRYLNEFYGLSHSLRRATAEKAKDEIVGLANFEQLIELGKAGKLDANDQHIVHIVDWLLQYAFDQRASDIHIEPRRDQGNIRFRIDGLLHLVNQIPTPVMAAVTSRIKAIGRMDVIEKRRPQDGRLKTRTPNGNEVEIRISSMPTAFGEKFVLRIFDPEVLFKSLSQLGFSGRDKERWHQMTRRPHGVILVTGPTGSGKTSTLYSTLKQLATPEVNVCTIEDPIENIVPQFNQMQVLTNIGVDFATGVRTLLRQDPDIIMVGEIRDKDTAEMAIQAALTGHLVFSTLHTNDAAAALTRLLDLGAPAYLLNATLIGVLAQRLVRVLCPHCKKTAEPDLAAWEALIHPLKLPPPRQVGVKVGCAECRNTGYRGRTGLYEMLAMTPNLRRRVHEGCDLADLRRQALQDGMENLRLSGARKVYAGITTLEEIFDVAPAAEEL